MRAARARGPPGDVLCWSLAPRCQDTAHCDEPIDRGKDRNPPQNRRSIADMLVVFTTGFQSDAGGETAHSNLTQRAAWEVLKKERAR